MDDAAESKDDEIISQFMAFTGSSDAAKAASYLEMSGNDVETAVGLYMEHETSSAARAADPAVVGGAMMTDDDIRAPDATRTMRLMDHEPMGRGSAAAVMMGMMPPGLNPAFHLMNAMMNEEIANASSAFAAPPRPVALDARAALDAAIAAQSQSRGSGQVNQTTLTTINTGEDVDQEEEDEDYEDEVAQPMEPANLTDMFSPPTHLIHRHGGFHGARAMAKDSKRWLLVNIQRDSEFASHALNRDVWRDELVENLVREGFIFWQQMDSMPEGLQYTERYHVQDYPHLAIIDPRTGRLLWRKEGWTQENPVTAASFAEIAMDFCSRNSFDRPPQAPRPGAAQVTRPAKRSVNEMSEAEQLEAAMRASIADATGEVIDVDNMCDSEIQYIDSGDDNNNNNIKDENEVEIVEESKPAAEVKAASLNDELKDFVVADEPNVGSRIQLRLPDGKRVVRRFIPSSLVRTIYAYVVQSLQEARDGREFSLMAGFPPIELINDIDTSIDECGLNGQTIAVHWK